MSNDAQNLSDVGNLTTDVYHQIQIPGTKYICYDSLKGVVFQLV